MLQIEVGPDSNSCIIDQIFYSLVAIATALDVSFLILFIFNQANLARNEHPLLEMF